MLRLDAHKTLSSCSPAARVPWSLVKRTRPSVRSLSGVCHTSANGISQPSGSSNSHVEDNDSQAASQRQSLLRQLAQPSLLVAVMATPSASGEIYSAVAKALDVYSVILVIRVLLTWFKGIKWGSEPFATLRQFTDPFLNLFRGVIPPIAGIDLSVMLGFFILSFTRNTLRSLSMSM